MGIEDFIKEYTTQILWAASIIIGWYTLTGGSVLSFDVKQYGFGKYLIAGLVALILYISTKLDKALIAEKLKEPKVVYKEQPKPQQPVYDGPFNFKVTKKGGDD